MTTITACTEAGKAHVLAGTHILPRHGKGGPPRVPYNLTRSRTNWVVFVDLDGTGFQLEQFTITYPQPVPWHHVLTSVRAVAKSARVYVRPREQRHAPTIRERYHE